MNTTHPIAGILILVLSTWALSTLDASGKWVMAAGISLFFMVWVRYIVHLVLVMTIVIPLKGWRVFKAKQPGMQLLRGVVMLLATYSFFTALSYLPQAESTAINFLAPLLMFSDDSLVLHSLPHISRLIAAIVGFICVLIIIRPGSGLHPVGVMFCLITACMFATQFIVTRKVAIDDSMTTLLWSGLVGSVLTTLSWPFVFQLPFQCFKGFS